jgi:hypothetical protein
LKTGATGLLALSRFQLGQTRFDLFDFDKPGCHLDHRSSGANSRRLSFRSTIRHRD